MSSTTRMAFTSKCRIRIVSNEERERLKNFRQKKLKPKPLPPLSPSPYLAQPINATHSGENKRKRNILFFVGGINHETIFYSSGLNVVTITAPHGYGIYYSRKVMSMEEIVLCEEIKKIKKTMGDILWADTNEWRRREQLMGNIDKKIKLINKVDISTFIPLQIRIIRTMNDEEIFQFKIKLSFIENGWR